MLSLHYSPYSFHTLLSHPYTPLLFLHSTPILTLHSYPYTTLLLIPYTPLLSLHSTPILSLNDIVIFNMRLKISSPILLFESYFLKYNYQLRFEWRVELLILQFNEINGSEEWLFRDISVDGFTHSQPLTGILLQ